MTKKRKKISWFHHYTEHGKTLSVLEGRWGNNGYAFFFKLLEVLCCSDGLYLELNDINKNYLLSITHIDETTLINIINSLVEMGKIDRELWENQRVIWYENLVDSLDPYRDYSGANRPQKPQKQPVRESIYTKVGEGKREEKEKENENERRFKDSCSTAEPPSDTVLVKSPQKSKRQLLTKTQQEHFERFWAAYPKKVSKGQAMTTWLKVNRDGTITDAIIDGVKRAKTDDSRFKTPKYTPHASSWLNAAGWMDDHASARADGMAPAKEMMKHLTNILNRQKQGEAV